MWRPRAGTHAGVLIFSQSGRVAKVLNAQIAQHPGLDGGWRAPRRNDSCWLEDALVVIEEPDGG